MFSIHSGQGIMVKRQMITDVMNNRVTSALSSKDNACRDKVCVRTVTLLVIRLGVCASRVVNWVSIVLY